jgi:hypothetical protein
VDISTSQRLLTFCAVSSAPMGTEQWMSKKTTHEKDVAE